MPTPKLGLSLGRRRDYHDSRDFIWRSSPHLLAGAGPSRIDVSEDLAMPSIYDQGAENSCTANAGIRWRRWLGLKFPQYSLADTDLSRQAQYYWERSLNGDTNLDEGSGTREIFQVLTSIGACAESLDPYSPSTTTSAPGQNAVDDARQRRIGAYHRIPGAQELVGCLLSGYAFTIGLMVYENFEDVGPDGVWTPSGQPLGGHEVFVHGYDNSINGGSFIADNSWGTCWGKAGAFYIPHAFLDDYSRSQWDAFTGHFGRPWG